MALYFFHLCDGGEVLMDPDGREVADESLLREMAIKDARAMVSHDALTGTVRLNLWIDVRDASGKLIVRVPFRDAVTVRD